MKIACLLGPDFEDSEFEQPYQSFKGAGHEVDVIGVESGKELNGYKGRVKFSTEKAISEVSPDTYDALFIPGGHSPDKLRANDQIVEFTRRFAQSNKPIFAICHGPQLLLSADSHRNRTMTAWKTVQGDLAKAGATVVDEEVCVDGNLVTSRMPDDIPAFIRKSLELMEQVQQGNPPQRQQSSAAPEAETAGWMGTQAGGQAGSSTQPMSATQGGGG